MFLSHHPVISNHKPEKVRQVSKAAASYYGLSKAKFTVPIDERRCLQILWRKDPELMTEVYQCTQLIFC